MEPRPWLSDGSLLVEGEPGTGCARPEDAVRAALGRPQPALATRSLLDALEVAWARRRHDEGRVGAAKTTKAGGEMAQYMLLVYQEEVDAAEQAEREREMPM